MDLQQQIDNLTKRFDQTLEDLEQAIKGVIEARENMLRLEISILNDRMTIIEQDMMQNNKMLCSDCEKCIQHCQCEINYLVTDLFDPKPRSISSHHSESDTFHSS